MTTRRPTRAEEIDRLVALGLSRNFAKHVTFGMDSIGGLGAVPRMTLESAKRMRADWLRLFPEADTMKGGTK